MRVCIITVYNSLNCGSFLQAFTLMKALQSDDIEVSFLETKARRPLILILRSSVRCIIKGKYKELIFLWCKWYKFRAALLSNLPTCKMIKKNMNKQDIYVMGSDEIWNISRKEFSHYHVFWGEGINDKKLIAYAPSINRASFEQIKYAEYPKQCLEKFSAIGVRDMHTKNVLKNLIYTNIELVLDPTLLFDYKFYLKYEVPIKEKNYILVYTYSNHLNANQIESIKKFAKRKNLPLISINYFLDWCDRSYPASPFEFLSFYNKASYIVTDTFHGTLFSVIYKKQFITYADDNVKILDFLDRFGLLSRNSKVDNDTIKIFENILDYDMVYQMLEEQRCLSIEYLRKALSD